MVRVYIILHYYVYYVYLFVLPIISDDIKNQYYLFSNNLCVRFLLNLSITQKNQLNQLLH